MEINHKKKEGFTLLEVVIVLAIIAIVSVLLYPFFTGNYKSLNSTTNKSELQHKAQMINSLLSQSLMEVKEITSIKNSTAEELLMTNGASNPVYIEFLTGEGFKYSLTIDAKGITKTNLDDGTKISTDGTIESLNIEPIEPGTSYSNTKGLKVILNITYKTEHYTTDNIIYFRNKK